MVRPSRPTGLSQATICIADCLPSCIVVTIMCSCIQLHAMQQHPGSAETASSAHTSLPGAVLRLSSSTGPLGTSTLNRCTCAQTTWLKYHLPGMHACDAEGSHLPVPGHNSATGVQDDMRVVDVLWIRPALLEAAQRQPDAGLPRYATEPGHQGPVQRLCHRHCLH